MRKMLIEHADFGLALEFRPICRFESDVRIIVEDSDLDHGVLRFIAIAPTEMADNQTRREGHLRPSAKVLSSRNFNNGGCRVSPRIGKIHQARLETEFADLRGSHRWTLLFIGFS